MKLKYFFSLFFISLLLFSRSCFSQQNQVDDFLKNYRQGFIENIGQVKDDNNKLQTNILFQSSVGNGTVFVTKQGLSYLFVKLKRTDSINVKTKSGSAPTRERKDYYDVERIDMVLPNANIDRRNIDIDLKKNSPGYNFFVGNNSKATTIKEIESITVRDIYPGIDWIIYANTEKKSSGGNIKYDFKVHPGADIRMIKLIYSSNANIKQNEKAEIEVKGKLGSIREGKPFAYIKENAEQVKLHYQLHKNIISFEVDSFDRSKTIIIDPDLFWGTYVHSLTSFVSNGTGGGYLSGRDITTDAQNNIFTMFECSYGVTVPTLNPGTGAWFKDFSPNTRGGNIFMKFNKNGVLLWSTFFGDGYAPSWAGNMTIDNNGDLYATGRVHSVNGNIPLLNNGGYYDPVRKGNFMCKFDNDGRLLWSTYFSAETMLIYDMDHDDAGNIYLTGVVDSYNMPKKDPGNGAYYEPGSSVGPSLFITKFSPGCQLLWSTQLRSNNYDRAARLCIDKFSNVYIAGVIGSSNYPFVNAGGYFSTTGNSVITKFNPQGVMVWSTCTPGISIKDITSDSSGNIFAVEMGYENYPMTDPGNGAYMDPSPITGRSLGGSILKFDQNTNLVWSTTFHKPRNFFFNKIVYEKRRDLIHIFGIMNDPYRDFPTKNDGCNGSFFYSFPPLLYSNITGPILASFKSSGKLVYSSLTDFVMQDYDNSSEFCVDNEGSLLYIFGFVGMNYPISAEKNPGGGAFFQPFVKNSDNANATFIMKLKPSRLKVNAVITPPVDCGCSGVATFTPTCGEAPFKYSWNTGQSTAGVNNLCPGQSYSVHIIDDNAQDTIINFKFPNPPGSISKVETEVKAEYCNRGDGKIQVTNITGGTSPYLYSWDNAAYQSNDNISGLTAGAHIISVKDDNGCFTTDTLEILPKNGPDSLSKTTVTASCDKNDGSISLSNVKRGTAPFTFSLDNVQFNNSGIFNMLSPGLQYIYVKDSAGCLLKDSVMVLRETGPTKVMPDIKDTHCAQSIGSFQLNSVTGGTPPYLYSNDSISFSVNNYFPNLAAGTYFSYIKDDRGCVKTDTIQIKDISGPSKIWITKKDAYCGAQSGTIVIDSVSKGSAPFLFKINNGNYTSLRQFANLNVGMNYITVKDAFNCEARDSFIIVKTENPDIRIINKDTVICYGEKIKIETLLSGNSNGIKFFWNNQASNNNFYIAQPVSTQKIVLIIRDQNGCTDTDSVIVSVKSCDTLLSHCFMFPNAFSPDNNKLNDEFGVINHSGCFAKSARLMVFGRWGQVVFSTTDITKKWKGDYKGVPLESGTFAYTFEWTDINNVVRKQHGLVILVR